MKKLLMIIVMVSVSTLANAMDQAHWNFQHWMQNRRLNGSSTFNQRMNFLQNWCVQNIQQNGGGQMGGMQPQDPMARHVMQLGQELRGQIQWFANFGEAALQNNRIEYAAHLARLQQLQQAVCNVPGCGEIATNLQMVINVLQELFNQTAPQNQPIGRATPRYS
jgi:hypothetical protein